MPYTVANQRTVNIHREELKGSFLGINNDTWYAASRDLGATALRLYLYLASNSDGYRLALSPAALYEEIGMPRSTYSDQFKKLIDKGYLKHSHGNTYEFFEIPQPTDEHECVNELSADVLKFEECTADDIPMTFVVQNSSGYNIEINNNISSINNELINTANNLQQKEELYPEKIIHISRPKAKPKKPIRLDIPQKDGFVF